MLTKEQFDMIITKIRIQQNNIGNKIGIDYRMNLLAKEGWYGVYFLSGIESGTDEWFLVDESEGRVNPKPFIRKCDNKEQFCHFSISVPIDIDIDCCLQRLGITGLVINEISEVL